MAEENKDQQGWRERLQHTYRLVIMNNETFEEIGSYRLSLLNVYVLVSTLVVTLAAIVLMLIVFTPLKRMIPGYADVHRDQELIRIYQQLDSMEQIIEAQRVYTENFRKMLTAQVDTFVQKPETLSGEDDSLDLLAVGPSEEEELLRQEVELEELTANLVGQVNVSPRELPLEQLYFVPPLQGEISAGFMPDKKHYGIDILAPLNTPVKAAMDGWVVFSDWTLETGNTLAIQHPNNVITFYKHNSSLLKHVGDYVRAGEAVAIIGNTGALTSGPHLHFELWYKGKPVNPVDYITF